MSSPLSTSTLPPIPVKHPTCTAVLSLLVGILFLCGIFYRFDSSADFIFWNDEVFTLLRTSGTPPPETLRKLRNLSDEYTAGDVVSMQLPDPNQDLVASLNGIVTSSHSATHLPFYYLTLRIWYAVVGPSAVNARYFSAMFMLVALGCAVLLIYELSADRLAALLFTGLFSASPLFIWYALEARMYALLLTLILLATYFLVRHVQCPAWRWIVAYSICSLAGLLTHPLYILSMVGQTLLLLIATRQNTAAPATLFLKSLFPWILCSALAALVATPWYLGVTSSGEFTAHYTMVPLTYVEQMTRWLTAWSRLFSELHLLALPEEGKRWLATPYFLLIIITLCSLIRNIRSRSYLTICCVFLLPALLLLGTDGILGHHRATVARYMTIAGLGILFGASFGLAQLFRRRPIVAILLLVICTTSGIYSINQTTKIAWWNREPQVNRDIDALAEQIRLSSLELSPITILSARVDPIYLLSLGHAIPGNTRLRNLKANEIFDITQGDTASSYAAPTLLLLPMENLAAINFLRRKKDALLFKGQFLSLVRIN